MHLKLTLRNLLKYPLFSAINLGGLAIGIAASFVLMVYSHRELSVDRHWQDADRIYRVGTDFFNIGGFATSQSGLRDFMRMSCKDIRYATSFVKSDGQEQVRTSLQERAFTDIYPYYIDSSFFKVFSFEAKYGAFPANGVAPGQAIVSADLAARIFGRQDAIGKSLLIGKENTPVTIVAVLKEPAGKSHLDPQLIMTLPNYAQNTWNSAGILNYVKLQPTATRATLEKWFADFTSTLNKIPDTKTVRFIIQPLTDIYFQSNLLMEVSPGGNLVQVKLLGVVSIFLILLAVINYVNLVTARASTRAKEIGVKQTFGASRPFLAGQLMFESIVFSFFAMILASGLIQIILYAYEFCTGSVLTESMPLGLVHYGWLLLFSLGVGILAGLYPAFYMTAFKPILSLRTANKLTGKSNPGVRNALVLVQFVIAASLVFISFVVYGQLKYMNDKDKGFRGQGVVLVGNIGQMGNKVTAFQQMVNQQSQVASTSFCNRTPAGETVWINTYRTPTMTQDMSIQSFPVDDQYIGTMGMRLSDGRNFNKDLVSDTNSLILNESAVAALGLFKPVGSILNGSEHVIGVIKDFNFASLHQKIAPVILRYTRTGNTLAVKLKGGHTAQFVNWLRSEGKKFAAEDPLNITFLDDNFQKLAEKDRLLGRAITFFTILAIILSVLGLTGLTLFTIERRRKEIGIRKILGATWTDIMVVISGSFTRIAAIASLVALPLSWWIVQHWLENFAYRTHVSVWTFFCTESVILLIAFSVIGLLTIKAAATNPVKTLHTE